MPQIDLCTPGTHTNAQQSTGATKRTNAGTAVDHNRRCLALHVRTHAQQHLQQPTGIVCNDNTKLVSTKKPQYSLKQQKLSALRNRGSLTRNTMVGPAGVPIVHDCACLVGVAVGEVECRHVEIIESCLANLANLSGESQHGHQSKRTIAKYEVGVGSAHR